MVFSFHRGLGTISAQNDLNMNFGHSGHTQSVNILVTNTLTTHIIGCALHWLSVGFGHFL